MKIITHRVNGWSSTNEFDVYGAEIDVQVCADGRIRAFHEPDEIRPTNLLTIFEYSKYKRFFVDIKQNLDIRWLKHIVATFGSKLIGLFDVPFPSIYYAHQAGLPVWDRLSEYEAARGCGGIRSRKFWLDPLKSWSPGTYGGLLHQTSKDSKVMICSPELHGCRKEIVDDCWGWMQRRIDNGDERIWGIVTKRPSEAKEFFNEIC